jgi:two-component system, chemotaxis family, response regulator Rcp1
MARAQTIDILLVEDNEGDIILIKEAFKEGKIKNSLSSVQDGQEAIDYLQKKEKYKNELKPDLILLDLNLPKVDGIEVLAFIKSDPLLKLIPVIILTTSSRDNDILNAYSNYANCYITKPVDFNRFMEVTLTIENFWASIVKLPDNSKS